MIEQPEATEMPQSGLRRLTVNFTPRAVAALDDLAGRWQDNRTDALNRAVLIAAVVARLADTDGSLTLVAADGSRERIHLI